MRPCNVDDKADTLAKPTKVVDLTATLLRNSGESFTRALPGSLNTHTQPVPSSRRRVSQKA